MNDRDSEYLDEGAKPPPDNWGDLKPDVDVNNSTILTYTRKPVSKNYPLDGDGNYLDDY